MTVCRTVQRQASVVSPSCALDDDVSVTWVDVQTAGRLDCVPGGIQVRRQPWASVVFNLERRLNPCRRRGVVIKYIVIRKGATEINARKVIQVGTGKRVRGDPGAGRGVPRQSVAVRR